MSSEIYDNDVFFELNKDDKAWHGKGKRMDTITPDFLCDPANGFSFAVNQEPVFLADGTRVSGASV